MKFLNDTKMSVKIVGGFIIVALIISIVAVVGYSNMKNINDGMTSLYQNRTHPIEWVGQADASLYQLRGDVYKYILIPDQRDATSTAMAADTTAVNQAIDQYKAISLDSAETNTLNQFDTAWAGYQNSVQDIINNVQTGKEQDAITSLVSGDAHTTRQDLDTVMSGMISHSATIAGHLSHQGDVTYSTSVEILAGVSVLGLLLAIALGLFLSQGITRPLSKALTLLKHVAEVDLPSMSNGLALLAKGDLSAQVDISAQLEHLDQQDEVGQIVGATNRMITRLQEAGQAFGETTSNLQSLIGQVLQNATSLGSSAQQLTNAAEQAGQATSQIATTIQQVAKGTAQQTEAITHTSQSVDQMGQAIGAAAQGAQDQASAVGQASQITTKISQAVEQVAGNAQMVTHDSAQATQAAKAGCQTVRETIQGMQTIQAARAGEHGKGFAVVADEVRKLAERASEATKEIGGLIHGIQATVNEAVKAMRESATEVENGTSQANKAGLALESISQAADAVYQQASQATAAADQMKGAVSELVGVVESVSAVVEQTNASTGEMNTYSNEVGKAMENIAAVSEENSAAVEEVSASAEEMSAQVEKVSASAQSLEEMARALQDIVAQFKLGEAQPQQSSALKSAAKPFNGPVPSNDHMKSGNGKNGQWAERAVKAQN